jgi:hypothetical protein
MAKGVPADIANAQPFRHRFNEHPHDRHRPVRLRIIRQMLYQVADRGDSIAGSSPRWTLSTPSLESTGTVHVLPPVAELRRLFQRASKPKIAKKR